MILPNSCLIIRPAGMRLTHEVPFVILSKDMPSRKNRCRTKRRTTGSFSQA